MYPLTLDLVRAESAWITPPSERLVACHWGDVHAGDRVATYQWLGNRPTHHRGARDLLCDGCADALDADAAAEVSQ